MLASYNGATGCCGDVHGKLQTKELRRCEVNILQGSLPFVDLRWITSPDKSTRDGATESALLIGHVHPRIGGRG